MASTWMPVAALSHSSPGPQKRMSRLVRVAPPDASTICSRIASGISPRVYTYRSMSEPASVANPAAPREPPSATASTSASGAKWPARRRASAT
jgi:hypothetical protein